MRVALVATILVLGPTTLAAQDLRLKRDPPTISWPGCPTPGRVQAVAAAQRQEADRLATAATQSSILGDNAAAADLLTRAAARDPAADRIAYRLARTLELLERRTEAVAEYCRYLSLAPDGTDATDARERLSLLTNPGGKAVPAEAAQAFQTAITHYDAGRLAEAEAAFSAALEVAPSWSDALYDRGVVRLTLGQRDAAADDLRRYLELNPGSRDFNDVLKTLGTAAPAVAVRYNPGSALAGGLLLPGLGHFTTGRPGRGMLVLGGAAGAAAAGFLLQRVEIQCLSPPVNGTCPSEQVLREKVTRPFLVPGLGAAAAIGVIGAIDAFRGAQKRNAEPAEVLRVGGTGGQALLLPAVEVGQSGTRVSLIRLRF